MRGPPNLRFLQMTPSLLHSAMPPLRPRDISAVSLSCLAAEGTMLSLLGRGARRLPSVRTSDCFPATLQSRLFGTSDLNVYGYDDLFPRQYLRQVDGARVCKGNAQQQPSTAGALLRWAILSGKRGELSLPLKATEVLEGGFLSFTLFLPHKVQQWGPRWSHLSGRGRAVVGMATKDAPLIRHTQSNSHLPLPKVRER